MMKHIGSSRQKTSHVSEITIHLVRPLVCVIKVFGIPCVVSKGMLVQVGLPIQSLYTEKKTYRWHTSPRAIEYCRRKVREIFASIRGRAEHRDFRHANLQCDKHLSM